MSGKRRWRDSEEREGGWGRRSKAEKWVSARRWLTGGKRRLAIEECFRGTSRNTCSVVEVEVGLAAYAREGETAKSESVERHFEVRGCRSEKQLTKK